MNSDKNGCIRAEWLHSGKSGCIRAIVNVFAQQWLYSGRVVIFGQKQFYFYKLLYSGNVVLFA